jgi:hypothetical protein
MKTHNEKLLGLSKKLSDGNVKKSWKLAKKITSPSKATRVGATIGLTMGLGILIGGMVGVADGKFAIGVGSIAVGIAIIITNVVNLGKKK